MTRNSPKQARNGFIPPEKVGNYKLMEPLFDGASLSVFQYEQNGKKAVIKFFNTDRKDLEEQDQILKSVSVQENSRTELAWNYLETYTDINGEKKNCIIEEFIPTTLREELDLEDYKLNSLEDRIRIGEDVLKAIKALHEEGYAHNDLHPGNIGRDQRNNLKIFDYNNSTKLEDIVDDKNDVELSTISKFSGYVKLKTNGSKSDSFMYGQLLYNILEDKEMFQEERDMTGKKEDYLELLQAHYSDSNDWNMLINDKLNNMSKKNQVFKEVIENCMHGKYDNITDLIKDFEKAEKNYKKSKPMSKLKRWGAGLAFAAGLTLFTGIAYNNGELTQELQEKNKENIELMLEEHDQYNQRISAIEGNYVNLHKHGVKTIGDSKIDYNLQIIDKLVQETNDNKLAYFIFDTFNEIKTPYDTKGINNPQETANRLITGYKNLSKTLGSLDTIFTDKKS
jgi:serine/threonine protein kinase